MTDKLVNVRDDIDKIDNNILELLKERIALAKNIGQIKNESTRAKWDPLQIGRAHV